MTSPQENPEEPRELGIREILSTPEFLGRFANVIVETIDELEEVSKGGNLTTAEFNTVFQGAMEEEKFPAIFNEAVLSVLYNELTDFLTSLRTSRDVVRELAERPDVNGALGQKIIRFLESISPDLEAYYNLLNGNAGAHLRMAAALLETDGSRVAGLDTTHTLANLSLLEAVNSEVRDTGDQGGTIAVKNIFKKDRGGDYLITRTISRVLGDRWQIGRKKELARKFNDGEISEEENEIQLKAISPKTTSELMALLEREGKMTKLSPAEFLRLTPSEPKLLTDGEETLKAGGAGKIVEAVEKVIDPEG